MEVLVKNLLRSILYAGIAYFTLVAPLITFAFKQHISCSSTLICSTSILTHAPYVIAGLSLIIYIVLFRSPRKLVENKAPFTTSDRIKIIVTSTAFTFLSLFTPLIYLHLELTSLLRILSGCTGEELNCFSSVVLSLLMSLTIQGVLLYFLLKMLYIKIFQKR